MATLIYPRGRQTNAIRNSATNQIPVGDQSQGRQALGIDAPATVQIAAALPPVHYGKFIWNSTSIGAYHVLCAAFRSDGLLLIFIWARLLGLGAGWLAACATAILAGYFLEIPELPVFLASGGLWTCLLLLE
jgi:hypothetical protein